MCSQITDRQDSSVYAAGMNDHEFGSRLRRLRRKRGVSQERLGDALGITHTSVSRWESGVARPSFENLVGIHDFLDASIDHLMFGHGPEDGRSPQGLLDQRDSYTAHTLHPGEWQVLAQLRQLTPETHAQIVSIIGKLARRSR